MKTCQKIKRLAPHYSKEGKDGTLLGRQARSQGSMLVQRSCSPGLNHDDDDDDDDDEDFL